ncbi:hypothetical protein Tco_0521699, partial [Tanacetum coccineum]
EIGESSTARPTGGRGVDYRFVSTVDAEARRQGIGKVVPEQDSSKTQNTCFNYLRS